jgi:hypothetical protein
MYLANEVPGIIIETRNLLGDTALMVAVFAGNE